MPEPKKILVVDDDDTLRESIQVVLRQHGYDTISADDGLEARRLIDRHRPDLVILDMMMPRWGGLAVLEHFKGNPKAPAFIVVSANEVVKHKAHAEKMGAATYLHKPFSLDQLMETVHRSISAVSAIEVKPLKKFLCRCPHCSVKINIPSVLLGKSRDCPHCKVSIVLQPESPKDEGVKLVP